MGYGEIRESPSRHFVSLKLYFLILLDVDVGVVLKDTDLLLWKFDGERLDESELVLDCSPLFLGRLLCFLQLLGLSIWFQGDIVKGHQATLFLPPHPPLQVLPVPTAQVKSNVKSKKNRQATSSFP